MKRKGLAVFFFLLSVALAAQSSESQPVSSVQLMAWLMAGVPSNRLVRIIQERGIAGVPARIRFINSKPLVPMRICFAP